TGVEERPERPVGFVVGQRVSIQQRPIRGATGTLMRRVCLFGRDYWVLRVDGRKFGVGRSFVPEDLLLPLDAKGAAITPPPRPFGLGDRIIIRQFPFSGTTGIIER